MHYVYILQLVKDQSYVGSTRDLKRRLEEHSEGKSPATRKYLPLRLMSYIGFQDRLRALRFELYLKTGSGRAFREKHFGI